MENKNRASFSVFAIALSVATAIAFVAGIAGFAGAFAGLAVDLEESLKKMGIHVEPDTARAIINWSTAALFAIANWVFAIVLMHHWRLLPWQHSGESGVKPDLPIAKEASPQVVAGEFERNFSEILDKCNLMGEEMAKATNADSVRLLVERYTEIIIPQIIQSHFGKKARNSFDMTVAKAKQKSSGNVPTVMQCVYAHLKGINKSHADSELKKIDQILRNP